MGNTFPDFTIEQVKDLCDRGLEVCKLIQDKNIAGYVEHIFKMQKALLTNPFEQKQLIEKQLNKGGGNGKV